MKNQLSFSHYFFIGVMLFALFFGAGNLIFPVQLGQQAGTNVVPAIIGFLITGVGLPLLGVLAMSFSGSNNLQELASRVHPFYGVFFTSLLYLTIGPFFAAPRTGTVAYEVGISPFVTDDYHRTGLLIFTILFFAITLFFSLKPAKIVDNVGKILAPGLVILLLFLLVVAFINPMGSIQSPQEAYADGAFLTGFLEGYNTMDALASLVFGIIVINVIKELGATSKKEILKTSAISGTFAIGLLAIIYVGISFLGASSVQKVGLSANGGPVLSEAASYYFGSVGAVVLAAVIILACLTTAIGLIIANSEYFHTLYPSISYKSYVVIFTLLTFTIANFGLSNIISYSIPVLMFLYPLAIVLILLTFLSPLFQHSRMVYVSTIAVTFFISIFDGLKALCSSLGIENYDWMIPVIQFYENNLPLYTKGLGWLLPALVVIIITTILSKIVRTKQVTI